MSKNKTPLDGQTQYLAEQAAVDAADAAVQTAGDAAGMDPDAAPSPVGAKAAAPAVRRGRLRQAAAELRSLRSLCGCAMLAALAIVLDQFKIILSPTLQISAAFLANGVSGWAFGPFLTALACIIVDLLSFILRPDGPFNFLWTVVAFVPGLIYGLVLYRRPVSLWRTALAKTLATVIVNLGLNPLCMAWLYGAHSYWYYLSTRLVKNIVLLPVEVAVLYALLKVAQRVLPQQNRRG